MRVCLLTAAYPSPAEATRAIFLENYLRALRGHGFDFHVVAPRVHHEDPLDEVRFGIRVSRFRYPASGLRLKEMRQLVPWTLAAYLASGLTRALEVVQKQSSDLLYAHWVLPTGLIGAASAALTGLPLVVHAHGSDIHRYACGSWLARSLARGVLRKSSCVFTVSRELSSTIKDRLDLSPEKLRCVPMGVDDSLFSRHYSGEGQKKPSDRLQLLFVGDIDTHKGVLEFTRGLVSANGLRERVHLHVVGDGPDRVALEELSGRNADLVTVYGRLSQEAVAQKCEQSDLLVLPSRGEGCPLAVMEALVARLPVLATPVGAIPDLVAHGERGWLEKSEDFVMRVRHLSEQPEEIRRVRERLARTDLAREFGTERRAAQAAADLERLGRK